jgi:hypothetical protein
MRSIHHTAKQKKQALNNPQRHETVKCGHKTCMGFGAKSHCAGDD